MMYAKELLDNKIYKFLLAVYENNYCVFGWWIIKPQSYYYVGEREVSVRYFLQEYSFITTN
jgi:hypothetical protein